MRWPHSSNDHARRAKASISSFALINLSMPTHIGTVWDWFARYRAAGYAKRQRKPPANAGGSDIPLTTQGHAQRTYVSAAVKSPEANRVFASCQLREIDGIPFLPAVGNPVIGKQRRPGCTI